MNIRKPALWTGAVLIVGVTAAVVTQPLIIDSIVARFRSTDHFLVLEEDGRIRYEAPARRGAEAVGGILDERQAAVEELLGASFAAPIPVFVCATQESFNKFVFLSKNARGATWWGRIFLAPGAFQRGSLSRLLTHELTHYLFHSHLGRAHVRDVPLWFREGIAEFVADGGPAYTADTELRRLVRAPERRALLSGEVDFWFETDDPRAAVTADGAANMPLYRSGALFVHFVHDSNPGGFAALIENLLAGEKFDPAFTRAYGRTPAAMLDEFSDYLAE